ncbi:TPA: hypothetical protein VDB83_005862 [Burkholderia cenocepacia]|nr:hypothetical protein [Burkholderia cenocepacia]
MSDATDQRRADALTGWTDDDSESVRLVIDGLARIDSGVTEKADARLLAKPPSRKMTIKDAKEIAAVCLPVLRGLRLKMDGQPIAASPAEHAAAPIPVGTIETFSGKHGLTWAVDPETLPGGTRLYAELPPAEVLIDSTEEAAEREYFRRWENELPTMDEEARDRAAPAQPAEAVAWKTTNRAVCVPITEDREVAEQWRANGWPVTEFFDRPAPAQAAEQVAIPTGWKLMPPSPTQAMRMAMAKAAAEYMRRTGGNNPDVIYEAAIAAAPQPPAQATILTREEIGEAWREAGSSGVERAIRNARARADTREVLTDEQIIGTARREGAEPSAALIRTVRAVLAGERS